MQSTSKKWWVLGTVSLAVFMAMLDITIVNVALPDIQSDLNVKFTTLQWVLNAYTLVYAVMLLPISKLGDIWGRKLVFIIGLLIFAVGSLASGLATDGLWLNIFRGFQGIGGAAIMSLSLTIVTAAFPAKQRGVALGIWSSAVGLAVAAGPLIGGSLVAAFGWRSIFLVNLPIGALAVICGIFVITDTQHQQNEKLDWWGMLLSIIMIFGAIFTLITKENHTSYDWTNWHITSLFTLAVVALILFIIVETRTQQPMMKLKLFLSPSFVGANIAAFTLGAGLYGGFTYLIILMQNYMGYSAFETGVRMLWISGFALIVGPVAGILAGKFGNRWLITIAMLIGVAGVLTIDHLVQVPFKWTALIIGFVLLEISNALVSPPISNAVMGAVAAEDTGMASGILNVFRQVGISFGVVILGLRLTAGYNQHLSTHLLKINGLPAQYGHQLLHLFKKAGAYAGNQIFDSKQALVFNQLPIFGDVKHVVYTAFKVGMQDTLMTIAILMIIGAAASAILIRDHKMH